MARMSNRERIERLAAEKAAADEEKKTTKATKKKTTKKKTTTKKTTKKTAAKTAGASGVRKVWKVFNNSFKEVETFNFPDKAKADKLAKDLTEKTGHDHFVNAVEVPME